MLSPNCHLFILNKILHKVNIPTRRERFLNSGIPSLKHSLVLQLTTGHKRLHRSYWYHSHIYHLTSQGYNGRLHIQIFPDCYILSHSLPKSYFKIFNNFLKYLHFKQKKNHCVHMYFLFFYCKHTNFCGVLNFAIFTADRKPWKIEHTKFIFNNI